MAAAVDGLESVQAAVFDPVPGRWHVDGPVEGYAVADSNED